MDCITGPHAPIIVANGVLHKPLLFMAVQQCKMQLLEPWKQMVDGWPNTLQEAVPGLEESKKRGFIHYRDPLNFQMQSLRETKFK